MKTTRLWVFAPHRSVPTPALPSHPYACQKKGEHHPALYVSKRVTSGTPNAILLLTALAGGRRESERSGEFEKYFRAPKRNPLRNRERGLHQNPRNLDQKRENPEALTSGLPVNQSDLGSSLLFVWLPGRDSNLRPCG